MSGNQGYPPNSSSSTSPPVYNHPYYTHPQQHQQPQPYQQPNVPYPQHPYSQQAYPYPVNYADQPYAPQPSPSHQPATHLAPAPNVQHPPYLGHPSHSYHAPSTSPQPHHLPSQESHSGSPYNPTGSATPQPHPYAPLASPPPVLPPTAWQQQQQPSYLQPQQQYSHHHQQLPQQELPPVEPSAVPPTAATPEDPTEPARPIKIKLKLPLNGNAPDMTARKRRASHGTARQNGTSSVSPTKGPELNYDGRPRRSTGRTHKPVSYVEPDDDVEFEEKPQTSKQRSRPTRANARYVQDDDEDEEEEQEPEEDEDAFGEDDEAMPAAPPPPPEESHATRRSSRAHRAPARYADDFENKMFEESSPVPEPEPEPIHATRKSAKTSRRRVIADPDDDDDDFAPAGTGGKEMPVETHGEGEPELETEVPSKPHSQTSRGRGKTRHSSADAESFAPTESEPSSSPSGSPDPLDQYVEDDAESYRSNSASPPRRRTRASVAARRTTTRRRAEPDSDDEYGASGSRRRNLRKRDSRPNYQLPPMDITAEIQAADIMNKAIASAARPGGARRGPFNAASFAALAGTGAKTLPWSMKGRDLAQAMGDPDSSDSDLDVPPMGAAAGGASINRAPAGPGIPGPTDVPNFGRINPKSTMADADPLGIDVNVTFDRVGGLDNHINQLKEMVALPLLYPELFHQFGITPPRGVLFHGPPGTGKTLLARALAASCSNGNTKIAFFMRKGADVLSKWVGEAERQLRMLFEEARACQPSIIFFDEIDGLAPVRSSKQDQIHASLVSTLLALMDGMDGRGQVIVIGATNRPDAVDPALRRPGRFDREFYFPLPNRDARRQIVSINTRNWEPPLPGDMLDTLATLTKGYGGADLRALCTEAALNAIQRRYPQIYKTTDRLQVQAGSVHVQPKDFMLAVKKIIPSSARSTASSAIQLPSQLVPLLSGSLEKLKAAVDLALPPTKKRTALEEAEYEDDDGDTFEKEMMLQSLDKLRTYRPRLLVYGPRGAGQTYLGPAILHHLEGFHVQSFDLATLMGDSTRTPEAAIVQLFVEAKRHQPSIIFIPSLAQWSATMTETARSTTRALLDGIPPSDPVLLLAIVDGPIDTLPYDVRQWFGFSDENRIKLGLPSNDQREEFFGELLTAVQRPPTDFPDGVPRRKRVLEELPLAEPLPARKPTEAEVQREVERDNAARNMLFVSFSSLVSEFMKKYRRPIALIKEDAFACAQYLADQAAAEADPGRAPGTVVVEPVNGDAETGQLMAQVAIIPPPPPPLEPAPAAETLESLVPTEVSNDTAPAPAAPVPAPAAKPTWQAHNIDMDVIQRKLVRHKYYTPGDFLADIALIEDNANHTLDADRQLKITEMAAHARMHVQSFDPKWTPEFEHYGERMRARKAERAKARAAREAEGKDGGTDSDTPAVDAAVVSAVNGLKRNREGDEEGSGAGPSKRPREDGMDVDSDPIESIGPNGTQLTESVDPIMPFSSMAATQVQPPVALQPEQSLPTTQSVDVAVREPSPATAAAKPPTPPAAAVKTPTPPAAVTKTPTPPSVATKTPTPPPVYPPFVVPETAVEGLGRILKYTTEHLNVDELEQLRAMLLDRVWRARSEWDRTALVADLRERTEQYVREVGEVRKQEHEEERAVRGRGGYGF